MVLFLISSLFCLGISGIFLTRKNLIILLVCIEMMLLSINWGFVVCSVHFDDILGQIMALMVLSVAAAESAIGLAILVLYYRIRKIINIDNISLIKG